jgi:O-antigen/teichoic acid export membrane protein
MIISSLFVFIYSNEIVYLLYGNEYIKSAKVLAIQFWIIVFVAMATISGKYFLNAGLQKITMKRHLFGLILNISLNYLMIPVYGIEGAAIASLISLILANYIFDSFTKDTRGVFFQKTKALTFFWIFESINNKIKGSNG